MRSRGSRTLALVWIFLLTAIAALAAERTPQTFGIPNATFPRPGVMVAGQPTGEQIQLLAEEGNYHAVIDLRSPEEPHGFDEPAAARDNGLAYINIPVSPATLDQATIDRFLAAMRTVRPPVLIHCGTASRCETFFQSPASSLALLPHTSPSSGLPLNATASAAP